MGEQEEQAAEKTYRAIGRFMFEFSQVEYGDQALSRRRNWPQRELLFRRYGEERCTAAILSRSCL
ncbi:MAG TPA: hypothetical protein VMH84_07685 [Xanthobacteraceae bacterium]|nr:hypothetical protein [Xanthobacteraceae bacterium]